MDRTKKIKLGVKAESFTDVTTGFSINRGQELEVELGSKITSSGLFKKALQGGHITWVLPLATPSQGADSPGTGSPGADPQGQSPEFEDMTKEQLTKYLEDNFEVTEEVIKQFEKKTKAEMIAYLKEASEEE